MKLLVLIVGVVVMASDAFAFEPYPSTWTFDVYRDGQLIGYHRLTFEQTEGGGQIVTTEVDLTLQKLGVPVYRYRHHATEAWQDGRLQRLDTTTDDNGVPYTVTARQTARGLEVERTAPAVVPPLAAAELGYQPPEVTRETFAVDTLPTSLWRADEVRRPVLLNTQYGRLSRVKVVEVGREPVHLPSSEKTATRFRFSGDLQMDLWFDDEGRWLKGSFHAPDGSTVEYLLKNL